MKGQPLLAILLALAGCTVGPDYTAPRLPTPTGFAESQGPQATPNLQGWWHAYHDPELDKLIAMGLTDSPDLKSAAARIRSARANQGGKISLFSAGQCQRRQYL
jgi:outer membrane protein TolC